MGFPLTIQGYITLCQPGLPQGEALRERLRAALAAQTVDEILCEGNILTFRSAIRGNEQKPRPEGERWMLRIVPQGRIQFSESAQGIRIGYILDTYGAFYIITALTVALGIAIHLSSGPDHQYGWIFGSGIWAVMFLSQYISTRLEFGHWLRQAVISPRPPMPKRMRSTADAG
jgi:hypothetical protein